VPWLPSAVVLREGVRGPDSWHWNLYTQSYLDLWGAPAREDWKVEHVINRITTDPTRPVRLGIVPDIPRFDAEAFAFYIAWARKPITLNRLWKLDEARILANDFILLSEVNQGFAQFAAPDLPRVHNYVFNNDDRFRLRDRFQLPNGDIIRLYAVE
jgi:hypothetical protein